MTNRRPDVYDHEDVLEQLMDVVPFDFEYEVSPDGKYRLSDRTVN